MPDDKLPTLDRGTVEYHTPGQITNPNGLATETFLLGVSQIEPIVGSEAVINGLLGALLTFASHRSVSATDFAKLMQYTRDDYPTAQAAAMRGTTADDGTA